MCYSTELFKRNRSTLSMSTKSSSSAKSSSGNDEQCPELVHSSLSFSSVEQPKKSLKRVRFSTLAIAEFETRIGDSIPSYGPPIGLGEALVHDEVWCVNHYESVRPKRKSLQELKMDPWKRTRMLYRQGYDPETIANAACEADTIRANRKENTFDEEKPVQERPGLIAKGGKKLVRLSNRLRLPLTSRRFNSFNTRA